MAPCPERWSRARQHQPRNATRVIGHTEPDDLGTARVDQSVEPVRTFTSTTQLVHCQLLPTGQPANECQDLTSGHPPASDFGLRVASRVGRRGGRVPAGCHQVRQGLPDARQRGTARYGLLVDTLGRNAGTPRRQANTGGTHPTGLSRRRLAQARVVIVLAGSSSQTHCRSRVTVRWNRWRSGRPSLIHHW